MVIKQDNAVQKETSGSKRQQETDHDAASDEILSAE